MAGASKRSAFGDELRRAREERGVALPAVSDATRIAVRHLEALERSDLDSLPPGPFGKGYVRTYAQFLGVDPEPILEAYRARERQRGVGTPGDDERLLSELSHLVGGRARDNDRPALGGAWSRSLALVLVLAGAAAVLWWFLGRATAPEAAAMAGPASGRESAEAGAPQPRPPSDPRAPGIPDEAKDPAPTVEAPGGETAATPAVAPPTDALRIPDFGVGTDLVDRRLVGRSDRFAEETDVVFWTRVLGGQPGHVIRHVWFQGARAVMRADLPIGGAHWRTRSRLLLPRGSAGPWTVEARTSDGRLLARQEFLCEPAGRR